MTTLSNNLRRDLDKAYLEYFVYNWECEQERINEDNYEELVQLAINSEEYEEKNIEAFESVAGVSGIKLSMSQTLSLINFVNGYYEDLGHDYQVEEWDYRTLATHVGYCIGNQIPFNTFKQAIIDKWGDELDPDCLAESE
jgi:hypothetical protein